MTATKPILIRDVTIQRWSWDGRFFLTRNSDPGQNLTPLFVPKRDILRFCITDWYERPRGDVQQDYHAALKFTEQRLNVLKIHHRIFVCPKCGQYAGDCTPQYDQVLCLACQGSLDEWRDGEILCNERVVDLDDREILSNVISEEQIAEWQRVREWSKARDEERQKFYAQLNNAKSE